MKLTKYKIKQFAKIVAGGTPSTKNPAYWEGNIPWITPNDLTSYKKIYISKGERNITLEGLKNSSAKLLPLKTVLLTTRAPVGYVAIGKTELSTNQGFKNLICDEKKADPEFIYYLLKKNKSFLQSHATGSTFGELSGSRLRNLEFNLPELNIQKKIAQSLISYDDLIAINHRRIQLLEEAARLLFREWFVYFRFPGHEKVKIVDGVPEGWKKTTLGNIANRIKKNYSINDEDLSLVDLARINSRTLAVTDVGVASDLETARIIFEIDDILFSSIRLYLHKVVLAPFRGITNTSVFVIRAKNPIYRAYITLLLFSDYAIQFANQHSTGTKMPVVKWGSVSKLPALIPHQTIMEDFQNMVWPMLEQIQLAYFQNQKLTKARDLLLPRLMSGEIEV